MQSPVIPWAEQQHTHAQIKADPSIGTGSMHRLDSQGILRNNFQSDLPVVFIEPQPRPKIGGRNVFLNQAGIYILAQGEGSFRALACTQANSGFVEILDWGLIPDKNEKEPLEYIAANVKIDKPRTILKMAPPILGQWPLDANFQYGLVVRIHAAGVSSMLTIVWFLASDIGGNRNGVVGKGNEGKNENEKSTPNSVPSSNPTK